MPVRDPAWAVRRNPLREAVRAGDPGVVLWVTSAWPVVLEIIGAAGADGALIDMEHTSHSVEFAERMIVSADAAGISAIIRPPSIDRALISRLLDAGAHGIVFPHVDDAETARLAVATTRYPPAGVRGWGGAHTRFALWQGGYAKDQFDGKPVARGVYNDAYRRAADGQALVIVLIETLRGVENAAEIIATEGVDAVIFGWGDLSVEVDFDQDRCREAAVHVLGECKRQGVGAGVAPGDEFWPGCFTIAGIDSLLMSAGLEGAVRSGLGEAGVTWIGLLLGSQRREPEPAVVYAAVRAEAQAAVDAGFAALVAPEHVHAEPYQMLQPWPLLAALRAALDGEFAAVGSVIAGLSSEAQMEGAVRTLRAIGEGPVGIALAAGYRAEDFTAFERDFDARYERRAQLLHALAAAGTCDDGWLWGAAGTAAAARRSSAAGVPWYGAPTLTAVAAGRIAARAGEDCVLRRDVLIGSDAADVAARWERYVAPKYGAYAAWGFTSGPQAEAVIAGTAGQVAAALAGVCGELSPRGLVLRLCWPEMDAAAGVEHIETFAAEVAPGLEFTVQERDLRT